MKIAIIIFAVIGLGLTTFGWWGTRTETGRHRFDEMAGVIPQAALALGGVLVLAALALAAKSLLIRNAGQ